MITNNIIDSLNSIKAKKDWNYYLANKINIEFILSLGCACRPAHSLRINKLRYFSSPFDWMMSYSLKTIEDIINNGIDDYFREYEVIGKSEAMGTWKVRDKKTGMIAIHSFKLNQTVEEQYTSFIKTMKKRFDRLIGVFNSSNSLCFISNRNDQLECIFEFCKFITHKFNKMCFYVNITDIKDIKNEVIEQYDCGDFVITNICFDDTHPLGRDSKINKSAWWGNYEKWKKVLEPFVLNPIENNIDVTKEDKEWQ